MSKPKTNTSAPASPKPAKPPGAHVAFRASPAMIEGLDGEAARLQRENPGLSVTRSDALRAVVLRGLARGRGVAADVEV